MIEIVAPVLVTMLIPSSALSASGIVCNTPSHLAYSGSLSLGHGTSRGFQCVSGEAHTPPANSRSARFRPWSARSCCAAP